MFNLNKNKTENNIQTVLNRFKRDFFIEYNNSPMETKILMKKYFQHIYRRWYYSSLVFNNYLSPSNIINKISLQNHTMSSTIFTIAKPIIKNNKIRDIGFNFYEYSVENHPVIKDICLLTSFFTPDREIEENELLPTKFIQSIKYKFTVPDIFYINYITNLSFELGIIKKLPSINCSRAQICYNADFWENDSKLQFDKIIKASISLSSKKLSKAFPEVSNFFTVDYLNSLIKNGVHIENNIESEFFKNLHISLKDIISIIIKEPNKLSKDEFNTLELFNNLGCSIETHFITIFAQYLGIINPVNIFTFIFPIEIQKYIKNNTILNCNPEVILFSPCSLYDLTNFGETYMGSKPKGIKLEIIPENINYKKLNYSLNTLNSLNEITLKDVLN